MERKHVTSVFKQEPVNVAVEVSPSQAHSERVELMVARKARLILSIFGRTCYQQMFCFNQYGDVLRLDEESRF